MKFQYHKTFQKQALKLKPAQKKRLEDALKLFEQDQSHPLLRNHSLTGNLKGHRSISFGGDWRAHYYIKNKNTYFFVTLDTHSQLYK